MTRAEPAPPASAPRPPAAEPVDEGPTLPEESPPAGTKQYGLPVLTRADFNRLAVKQNRPLFWIADRDEDFVVDPDELVVTGTDRRGWRQFVKGGKLTRAFEQAYRAMVELRRREAVGRELDSGRPTVVHTDFTSRPAVDRQILDPLLAAARVIEALHRRQTGAARLERRIARADAASQMLFWRNHGPWCHSPATRGDRFCHGLPDFPPRRSEHYPADMPQDDAMCKRLQAQPNARQLLDPFTVVRRGQGGKLAAVPITRAFGPQMRQVAAALEAAARAARKDPGEQAFVRYLEAAAAGFRSGDWAAADEAWAAMNSHNSKWYLRIAPDEVYWDVCQQKAGFHVSLARIDKESVAWQRRLTPLREKMERSVADLIGAPYSARKVQFHMPDFIHIVLNAGNSRHPMGATIGQSLPNWGKVAREGRGRTVVMSNLYTDPDSVRIDRIKAGAMLSEQTMARYTADPEAMLLTIILHEATHNFGPHSDYRVEGKTPKELFGGRLASIMEELKAQTGGLWYLKLLRDEGLIDQQRLEQAYLKAITWAFGHISRGMFTPGGNVRTYSQVAAVQVGRFMEQGALSFSRGRFTIHFDRLPAAIEELMKRVGRIKATGDSKAAQALVDRYIKGEGHALVHEQLIARKLLRLPKATFLYSVKR